MVSGPLCIVQDVVVGDTVAPSLFSLSFTSSGRKKKKKIAEELAAFPASSSYTESFECVCVFMPQQSKKKKKGLT